MDCASTNAIAELKTLGRYTLERVLGKGAMGVVYEALDPRLNRRVAIKTILISSLDEDTAKEFALRFVREAQAVARLNHPNIVQVHDFGEESDIAYLVMELIRGKELKKYFDANERFSVKDSVRMMCELLEALEFAHQAGIVHRDVKPGNVMLDPLGRAKLTDFGVARVQGAGRTHGTQNGTMVGTPAYMSPEQITGDVVDGRSDVFSAGIILYQFLTGEQPFTGGGAWTVAKKIMQDVPALPSSINTSITPLFDAVVKKALAKSADQRFQSAKDFGIALRRALEGKPLADDSDDTIISVASPARRLTETNRGDTQQSDQVELVTKEEAKLRKHETGEPKRPASVIAMLIAVVVVASLVVSIWYMFKPDVSTQEAELKKALDTAKQLQTDVKEAQRKQAELQKEVELARQRAAEARLSGDVAKEKEFAEQATRREADGKKSGDIAKQKELAEQTKQREAEALNQNKLIKQFEAELAKLQAEQKKRADAEKLRETELAEKANTDPSAVAARTAAEKIKAEQAVKTEQDKAEQARVEQCRLAGASDPGGSSQKIFPKAGDNFTYQFVNLDRRDLPNLAVGATVTSATADVILEDVVTESARVQWGHVKGNYVVNLGASVFSPYLASFETISRGKVLAPINNHDKSTCMIGWSCFLEARVVGNECVKVPAGTFDAVKIEIRQNWASSDGRNTEIGGRVLTVWYSSQTRRALKFANRERVTTGGGVTGNFDLELTRYQIK